MSDEIIKKIYQNIKIHDENLKRVFNIQSETLKKIQGDIDKLKNEVEYLRSDIEMMSYNINLLVNESC
jgi:archaellum component FlaC